MGVWDMLIVSEVEGLDFEILIWSGYLLKIFPCIKIGCVIHL